MNNKKVIGLSVAIIFQIFILTGMYVKAAAPLWTGTEIKVKTIPVDPRSMFRGNYALLVYEFSRVNVEKLPDHEELRNGEIIYTLLKPNNDGMHEFSKISLEQPTQGIFLRGRIESRRYENKTSYFRIKYGIEAYFAPKEKALALERKLRNSGVAVLMVTGQGKARLKEITSH